MFHNPKNKEIKFYKPKYLSMFNTFYPQNYFVAYLPEVDEIELRQHNTNTDDIPYDDLINISKPIYDAKIIQQIEESCEAFLEFVKSVISKEQEKAREKLFASTDVLQRAKALYDLLKIPQKDQEEIYKQITDEDEVLNFGLMDYNYLAWEEIGWQDKDDINAEDLFSKYGFYTIWSKYHEKSAEFTDEFAYMTGLGREILKHGKTLCCFIGFEHKYVIIESHNRAKMNDIVQGLKKSSEIDDIVFFDEVEQIYPLPNLNIFEQISYEIKPHKNRAISNVRSDLIKLNEYLLGDSVPQTIDAPLPIFTNIKVEWKLQDELYYFDEKFVLSLPENGFSFVSLCFLLEQKISELTRFANDVFSIQSFKSAYDNKPIFILELSSQKYENAISLRGYKELISIIVKTENQQKILNSEIEKLFNCETDKSDILFDIKSFAEDNDIPFIIHLDWKSPIEELDDYLGNILKNTYPKIRVKLPTAKDFNEEDTVGTDGVFEQYDKALRKTGLQFGFFDTQSDDCLIVVHRTIDQERMIKIFNKMRWGYFEENGE